MQHSNKTVLENMVPFVRIIYPGYGEIIFEEVITCPNFHWNDKMGETIYHTDRLTSLFTLNIIQNVWAKLMKMWKRVMHSSRRRLPTKVAFWESVWKAWNRVHIFPSFDSSLNWYYPCLSECRKLRTLRVCIHIITF